MTPIEEIHVRATLRRLIYWAEHLGVPGERMAEVIEQQAFQQLGSNSSEPVARVARAEVRALIEEMLAKR